MANTYYDSELTAEEIEEVLEAINGILNPANNGKVLAISNGRFEARSVQWGGDSTLEPLSVTANGDYYPEAGVDGFDEVHVSVPNSYTASDEGKVVSNGALIAQTARTTQITENGTYDTTLNDEVTVNVSGGGSAVVQPLSVTQNGTYTPPSGVDGYGPVIVDVPSGSTGVPFVESQGGGAYFDTGIAGNTVYKIEYEFVPLSLVTDNQTYAAGASNNFTIGSLAMSAGPSSGFIRVGNIDFGTVSFNLGQVNKLVCDNGSVYLNDTQISGSYSGPINTNSTPIKLLGGVNNSHSRMFSCKFYNQSGDLIANFIPFLKSNYAACLKDVVTDTIKNPTVNKLTFGYAINGGF